MPFMACIAFAAVHPVFNYQNPTMRNVYVRTLIWSLVRHETEAPAFSRLAPHYTCTSKTQHISMLREHHALPDNLAKLYHKRQ